MLRTLFLSASALAFFTAAANAAPLAEDAKAFGTREYLQTMDISPSGQKVVMLVSGPGATTVVEVADLQSGKIQRMVDTDGKPERLSWCSFAGESSLVCRYGGIDRVDNLLVGFSRLITLGTDGAPLKQLGQKASSRDQYIRQSDGAVIDWLPGEQGQVLMARAYVPEGETTGRLISRTREGLGVDKIDLKSLKVTPVETPRKNADIYLSDGRGNVRLMGSVDADHNSGQLSGIYNFRYRLAGAREWRDLGSYNSQTNEGFYPLAVDADANALYALRKTNGRDALYRVALDGSARATLVAQDPMVDIDNVLRLGDGQRVIGYTFADERRRSVYFDPEFTRLQAALAKAIPDKPLIDFHGASADGQQLLVLASADTDPGTFYRFNKATKKLEELALVRPALEKRALAKVQPIAIPGANGVRIPAYVTIPAGSSGKNLPAVVLPHGGPSARDEWGFDWLAQFLAARGFAVIQPNYRGSAGYGDTWLAANGFQGWRTSIGDVTAAANYLVAQGIADPKRLAIVGWSYGGYAALQSAATQPGLYKAVVAIAPVTDLAKLRQDAEGFTNRDRVRKFIGSGPHLVEGSPARNAAAIASPVLLVHGDMDANVLIGQSERMESALRAAGKPVEMLRYRGLDHQLDDSQARVEMLTRIGQLLERTTGP
ncbi:MAG TPA: S9 family peptidase [Sphingomicrobium sp.]|nr:S9 family peptidase [Sphingomicrobium sp.]